MLKYEETTRLQLDAGISQGVAFPSLSQNYLEKNCVSNKELVKTCKKCCQALDLPFHLFN